MPEKFTMPIKTGPNRGPGDRGFSALDFKIAKLELKPGDVLVVKSEVLLDAETSFRLRELVQEYLPGNKVLVLGPGFDFMKLSPAEKIEA